MCRFSAKIVRGMNNKLMMADAAMAAKENDDDLNNDISRGVIGGGLQQDFNC